MAALLLADGRVHRPFNWIFSLSTANHGSGNDPILKVVEWSTQTDYESDVSAGDTDLGSFVSVDVPGYSAASFDDTAAILLALAALGGDYAGSSQIS